MPNGFNYDIVVEDNGTGNVGAQGSGVSSALSIFINGLGQSSIPEVPFSSSYSTGFGYVNLSVTGTSFTSAGGGPNCSVTGIMLSQAGVPNTIWSPTGSNNSGCTSLPEIALSSPTGSGAEITATLGGTSMNSTTSPLMVPGYVSAGEYLGIAGNTPTQTPTTIDEFAIFSGNLNEAQISNIFSQTKFYQLLLRPSQASVPVLIFDNDGCNDLDNEFALQMAVALHQQGSIDLEGAVSEDGSVT
jgi:hypothetical protein